MKKRTLIVFGFVMFLCTPAAMAGTVHGSATDTVDLGLITMPRHDYEQMKALVAGTAVADSHPATRPVVMEAVGPAEMAADEAAALRQMVAGNYTSREGSAPSRVAPDVQLGLLSMPQGEYEALESMVEGYRINWGNVFAGTASKDTPGAGR